MENESNFLKTGTTTLGIVCKDGVVFASDKRATMGSMIAHKDAKKTNQISAYICMTMAGAVSHAQAVIRMLKVQANLYRHSHGGKQISVKAMSTVLTNVLCSQPLNLQVLIGGIDKNGGSIYNIGGDGSSIKDRAFSATGSGSPFVYGILEAMYFEGMSIEEGIKLAVKAVKVAMERDSASGNGVLVTVITKDGYREIDNAEDLLEE